MRAPLASYRGFQAGRTGGAAAFMPAWSGVRFAFRALHGTQARRTVFPGGLSSLSPWDHVVDRQFLGAGLASAILAGRVISFEQVAAAESHGLVPRPIVTSQGQDFGQRGDGTSRS